jgi:hypothetical protein
MHATLLPISSFSGQSALDSPCLQMAAGSLHRLVRIFTSATSFETRCLMSPTRRGTDKNPPSPSSSEHTSAEFDKDPKSSDASRDSLSDAETASMLERGSRANSPIPGHRNPRYQQLPLEIETEPLEPVKEAPVTWRSLPRKDQLLVLTLARLSEPLTQTSLGSYIYYQLQSFDRSLPDSTIASQAGIIHAAFPFAQFLTAILWGRFADSEYGGRKRVIWIGLLGTLVSIVGFGFSSSFAVAVAFRCLGGVLNGNIGVMRTMISEIIKEKKYQSRAFLVLPMTFNIGVIVGPILGIPSLRRLPHTADITKAACWQIPLQVTLVCLDLARD